MFKVGGLKKNFSWGLVSNVLTSISQWLVLTVIARIGGVEPLGEYALALSLCGPIIMFCNLGLRFFQATDVAGNYKTKDYLFLRAIGLLVALITIAIVGLQFDIFFLYVILSVALYKILESCSDILYGFFQKNGRMDIVGISLTITALMLAAFFSLVYLSSDSLVFGLLIMALVRLVTFIFFDFKSFWGMKSKFVVFSTNNLGLRQLAYTALPLGFVAVLNSFSVNIPRYFLATVDNEDSVGIFVALSYIIIAGVTVVNSLMHPLMPILSSSFQKENLNDFYKLLTFSIGFALLCGIGGVLVVSLFSNSLLVLLYGDSFSGYSKEFFLLSIVGAVNLIAFSLHHVVTSLHKFRMQFFVLLVQFLIIFFLSMVLVPKQGLVGAIVAWGGGVVAHVICSSIVIVYVLQDLHSCAKAKKIHG